MPAAVISAGLVLMWSSGFVGAELGTRQAGADTLLMWRAVAAAVLLGSGWLLLRRRRIPLRVLAAQAVIGLLSQAVYLGSIFWAVGAGVPAGTSALIAALQPLAAGALAGPLLGETVTRRQWAGLVTGLAGATLVVADDLTAPGAAPPWAYALPFTGMAGLLAASFLERRTPRPLEPVDALPVHCLTSALAFTAIAAAAGHATPPGTGSFWLAVAWVVLLSTVGGYGFYWLSLRRSGVTRTSALIYLTPPTTAVWAYAMFGESMGTLALAGLAVSVAGVVTATLPVRERAGVRGRVPIRVRAKEPQTTAVRYPGHDCYDPWLEPSADRRESGGGGDGTGAARRVRPADRR
ncbi:DMT family transporter [Streptomyces armeniacus]|uniref:DMT family transporter n=1 Tax=Streptomyces armeniacus TaxID=83291 RepID=A0A345XN16_9ACTN|nr:DMT family transporter [Streptomyces armeniacus]AXK33032.1 DMT family transporter [Streptomyces armeniacus]